MCYLYENRKHTTMENAQTKKEDLKNNIDWEEQRETAESSKETEKNREKFDSGDSHADNGNGGGGKKKNGTQDPKLEHDEDLDDAQSPDLHRKKTNEQDVEVDNKSHLDGEEG